MLSTLIYRSHLSDNVPLSSLDKIVQKANKNNQLIGVTGILLFNGTHFLQVLEGPEQAVSTLYEHICRDPRHHNVVELMRDYAPFRRFGNVGMELFSLHEFDKASVLQAVLDKGTSEFLLTWDDRALQFLRTFVESWEKENYFEIPPAGQWEFIATDDLPLADADFAPGEEISFAFQPIIDPLAGTIVSLEALLRSAQGLSPLDYFASLPREELYRRDLESKSRALALAKELQIDDITFSINLLPMTLVEIPNAVDYLLGEIARHGLVPQQIVVEVTETEVISNIEAFSSALKHLKAAGISLAIDDFGAGSAGLLLLSRVQPEKIKIDRNIISDVHKSGPKQAIVQAIIKCCSSLEIAVIAEGVEKPEEWMWLEAAGICQFQGFLFAKPLLKGIPPVAWPELK